jgi:hypothetical protein
MVSIPFPLIILMAMLAFNAGVVVATIFAAGGR